MKLFIAAAVVSLLALRAEAGEMVRVIEVRDGRTLLIDRNGTQAEVRLGGIEVLDERAARELLRWMTGNSWTMIEPATNGGFLAYRNPDALFLNRELVHRGYARATIAGIEPFERVPMLYLGVIDPGQRPPQRTGAPAPGAAKPPAAARTQRAGANNGGRAPRPRAPKAPSK